MDENADTHEPDGVVTVMTYEERVDEFFRLLSDGVKPRAAAANVGLPFTQVYRERAGNPEFAKRWADAIAVPVKRLKTEALRRAMSGSDKLLIFMLQSLAPEEFGKRERVELTNPDGSLAPITPEDRAAKVEALLAVAKARKASKAVDDLL